MPRWTGSAGGWSTPAWPPAPRWRSSSAAAESPPLPTGPGWPTCSDAPPFGTGSWPPWIRPGPELPPAVQEAVEITVKYQGYISRQLRQVEEMKRLERTPLPEGLEYSAIQGLRLEARQKLDRIRPKNLGQASRVSGVSPADVAVLMVYLKQNGGG